MASRIDHAAPAKIVGGKTRYGKDIFIKRQEIGQGFTIGFENGGDLPMCLRGLWMREEDAKNAINSYEYSLGKVDATPSDPKLAAALAARKAERKAE